MNKDGDNLDKVADGKLGNVISMVDANKYIHPGDLLGAITVVSVDAAATSARTLFIPVSYTHLRAHET